MDGESEYHNVRVYEIGSNIRQRFSAKGLTEPCSLGVRTRAACLPWSAKFNPGLFAESHSVSSISWRNFAIVRTMLIMPVLTPRY